jgi:hypothetical protein
VREFSANELSYVRLRVAVRQDVALYDVMRQSRGGLFNKILAATISGRARRQEELELTAYNSGAVFQRAVLSCQRTTAQAVNATPVVNTSLTENSLQRRPNHA